MSARVVYIAGPMRGFPRFNFEAFDEAEEGLREMGYIPISPAAMDREVGFDPDTSVPNQAFLEEAMRRDVDAILDSECMVMLPGWQSSVGATAEYHLAKWKHIPIYSWPGMDVLS